jgi:hypothetical protein
MPNTTNSVAPQVCDYVTIIQSIRPARVGKFFTVDAAGIVSKRSVATVTEGVAQSYRVPTAPALVELLKQVAESENLVTCTSLWLDDTDHQPFAIVPEKDLAAMTGFAAGSAELAGIHELEGGRYSARLKRGLMASVWLLVEADDPPGIPDDWRDKNLSERIAMLAAVVPGIDLCERVQLRGSTARVCAPGEAPGDATHAYIRISDPAMLATLKAYVGVQTVVKGLSFPSPRYSRTTGEPLRPAHRTLIDLSVWVEGRLIFGSKPHLSPALVADGWTVADAGIEIINEGGGVLDVSGVEMPDAAMRAEYQRITGEALVFSGEGQNLSIRSRGLLTLETEIESGGTVRTFGAWLAMLEDGKTLRCEAPFRDSQSEAALMRRTGPQAGQIFDVGNGTLYVLENARPTGDELNAELDRTVTEARELLNAPATRDVLERSSAALRGIEPPPPRDEMPAVERLAMDFQAANLSADVLPDYDETRQGYAAQRQITTGPRVSFVMRQLQLAARMNVYERQPLITSERSDWYQPASDSSAAMLAAIVHACARCGMSTRPVIEDAAVSMAGANLFNPVLEWAASEPWDGTSRFQEFASTLVMADARRNAWRDIVLRRFMIQAVEAWRNAGRDTAAKAVPYVPVLQGPQGIGKSMWVTKALLPDGWVKGDMSLKLDHGERDAVTRVTANPIVELAEVDASFRKSDVSGLKAFLNTAVDLHRPPYGRKDVATPRCTVYVATVNAAGFLVDETGSRRFWPLAVKECRWDHGIDLQQLWAEVLSWIVAGEDRYWLDATEATTHAAVVADHASETPVRELVIELTAARTAWPERTNAARWEWQGSTKLLQQAGIGHDPARMGEFATRMKGEGFKRKASTQRWRVPNLTLWRQDVNSERNG